MQLRPNRIDGGDLQALLSRNFGWVALRWSPPGMGFGVLPWGHLPLPAQLLPTGWRHFPTLSFCPPDFYSSKRRIVPDKPKPDKPKL